jgi:hypothetical protein
MEVQDSKEMALNNHHAMEVRASGQRLLAGVAMAWLQSDRLMQACNSE